VKTLFLGDIVGQPGRNAVHARLADLIDEYEIDFVVANGENAANGVGITSKIARRLLEGGVDVITTGNHVWRQRDVYAFLVEDDRILRPANFPVANPGRGVTVRPSRDGGEVAVVNLMGSVFMDVGLSPFRVVDALVDEATQLSDTVIVDFHAEATSEKVAMGKYLDGRVTAVVGTHTHVPTADERVTSAGTAYITDVGMCGSNDSVIGVRTDIILRRFTSEMPVQFEVADADVRIDALVVESQGGRATDAQRIQVLE
jgi:metallophosphoesterase (TIGR00282 family)